MRRPDFQSLQFYERTAALTDLFNRITAFVEGVDPAVERRKLIDQLALQSGQSVLEVAVGTGSNIPFIYENIEHEGVVVGLDISRAMVRRSRKKITHGRYPGVVVQGDGVQLPFIDNSFDSALHFGGINAFSAPRQAIRELIRVTNPGGRIVVSDKSFPPDRAYSPRQRLLRILKPRLTNPPPIDLIPRPPDEINKSWFWNGAAYILAFDNPGTP